MGGLGVEGWVVRRVGRQQVRRPGRLRRQGGKAPGASSPSPHPTPRTPTHRRGGGHVAARHRALLARGQAAWRWWQEGWGYRQAGGAVGDNGWQGGGRARRRTEGARAGGGRRRRRRRRSHAARGPHPGRGRRGACRGGPGGAVHGRSGAAAAAAVGAVESGGPRQPVQPASPAPAPVDVGGGALELALRQEGQRAGGVGVSGGCAAAA